MSSIRSIANDASRHVLIDRDDDVYQAYADVALTPSGKLVCVWRETPAHAPGGYSRLVMRESLDLGQSWSQRRVLDDGDRPDFSWDTSKVQCLRDGRLVVAATSNGSQGFMFWSDDEGKSWLKKPVLFQATQPCQMLEPRRMVELDDGTLLLPIEEAGLPVQRAWRSRARPVLYASTDQGETWQLRSIITDSPVLAHCEAPIVKLKDGTLVCFTRENSGLHFPSFKLYSYDDGRTWTEPQETGLFGYQPNASVLNDGRVLFTYLNVGGRPSVYAWCGDGYDPTGIQASACWGEDRCATLTPEGLRIKAAGDPESVPPYFLLHPAESDQSTIIFEARLKCIENLTGDACVINVIEGGEVRFYPDRVEFFHNRIPLDSKVYDWYENTEVVGSFDIDAAEFHTYRIVRDCDRTLTITVDGVERLKTKKLMRTKPIGMGPWGHDYNSFGCSSRARGQKSVRHARVPRKTRGESYWHYVKLRVINPTLPEYRYTWHAASGEYPNQYERDNILEIAHDPNGDSGEPAVIELPDGRIYCVYHTAAHAQKDIPRPGTDETWRNPYIMGCHIHMSDLP